MLHKLQSRIPEINSALFIAVFFFLPMHVAPAYSLTCLMLLLCLAEGGYKEKWQKLKSNPLFWIFQAFFWMFVLSLLWTEDLDAGFKMVGRYAFFLLSPVYILVARRELLERCISSFLAGCAVSEILAYYNWLQMHAFTDWPAGIRVRKSPEDTAPFVDRILYAPILAWAAYLAAHRALNSIGIRRAAYAFLALATLGNLIFSGGRAGQLTFLVLLGLLMFQHFSKRPALAALVSAVLISSIAYGSYMGNSLFRERTDQAIHEITHYQEAVNTSVGARINFYINSIRIIANNPILGVGAGDFPAEYQKINEIHSPEWVITPNPHNQHLYVLATTGIIGGMILFLVYAAPLLPQNRSPDTQMLRTGLVVFTVFMCLFESYLWRSNTSLLYVIFAISLYRKSKSDNL